MSDEFKPAAIKETIGFAEFDRIDVRVGTIKVPERKVPNGTRAG